MGVAETLALLPADLVLFGEVGSIGPSHRQFGAFAAFAWFTLLDLLHFLDLFTAWGRLGRKNNAFVFAILVQNNLGHNIRRTGVLGETST